MCQGLSYILGENVQKEAFSDSYGQWIVMLNQKLQLQCWKNFQNYFIYLFTWKYYFLNEKIIPSNFFTILLCKCMDMKELALIIKRVLIL